MRDLPKIPSEYIIPYWEQFFVTIMESIATGYIKPAEAKLRLRGVESFISQFGGVHSSISVSNVFYVLNSMTDDEMLEMATKTIKDNR